MSATPAPAIPANKRSRFRRFRRLWNRGAIPGELLIAWAVVKGILGWISLSDTVESHMSQLFVIWHFLGTPPGNLLLFALGLAWLIWVLARDPSQGANPRPAERQNTEEAQPDIRGGSRTEAVTLKIEHAWQELVLTHKEFVQRWNGLVQAPAGDAKANRELIEDFFETIELFQVQLQEMAENIGVERDVAASKEKD